MDEYPKVSEILLTESFSSLSSLFASFPKSVDYSKVVCPVAKSLRDQTVSLFLHPSWERAHIEKVIDGVKAVIANHSK